MIKVGDGNGELHGSASGILIDLFVLFRIILENKIIEAEDIIILLSLVATMVEKGETPASMLKKMKKDLDIDPDVMRRGN